MSLFGLRIHPLGEACANVSSRPTVLVAAGASGALLATCALLSYCAAGSPRWKGAPALAGPAGDGAKRCCGRRGAKTARPQANGPAATVTVMPSGTHVTADPRAPAASLRMMLALGAEEGEGAACASMGNSFESSVCALVSSREVSDSLSSCASQDSDGDRVTMGQNTPSVFLSRCSSEEPLDIELFSEAGLDALDDCASVDSFDEICAATPNLPASVASIEGHCAEPMHPPVYSGRMSPGAAAGEDKGARDMSMDAATPLSGRTGDADSQRRGDGLTSSSLSFTCNDMDGLPPAVLTHRLLPPSVPLRLSPAAMEEGDSEEAVDSPRACTSPSPPLPLQKSLFLSPPTSVIVQEDYKSPGHSSARVPTGALGHLTEHLETVAKVSGEGALVVAPPSRLAPSFERQSHIDIGCRGRYRIGSFLGCGWCGKVYEYFDIETGQCFAVKELLFDDKDPKVRQRLHQLRVEKEVLTLAAQHAMPWIVGFYGAVKYGHSVLIFLEYCARGSLLDYVMSYGILSSAPPPSPASAFSATPRFDVQSDAASRPASASRSSSEEANSLFGASCRVLRSPSPPAHRGIPEMPNLPLDELRRFTQQTLEALQFMHSNGYVHLDVKTTNILVTATSEARLADFGCSMRIKRSEDPTVPYAILSNAQEAMEMRGTAQYMAPEMIRWERERIGTPADVWSLGCVVMEVATGAAPWSHLANGKMRLLYCVASTCEDLPLPPGIVHAAARAKEKMRESLAQREETGAAGERKRGRESSRTLDELCAWARISKKYQRLVNFVALEEFLTACLHIHPEERYSCEELLRHPFLKGCA